MLTNSTQTTNQNTHSSSPQPTSIPTDRNGIVNEIRRRSNNAADDVRRQFLSQLSQKTGNDTVLYASGHTWNVRPDVPALFFSISDADMHAIMTAMQGLKGRNLDLVIHSPGGSLESTERIVNYLRSRYTYIRAIVPMEAMSAATLLAVACDEIVMGTHSCLGPIDPQITLKGGMTASAHTFLAEFNAMAAQVLADRNSLNLWGPRIMAYPNGFLETCTRAIKLSTEKAELWLAENMLKNDPQKTTKSKSIAKWLSDANQHMSHGTPFNIRTLQAQGLNVTPLEKDQWFQDLVLAILHSAAETFGLANCVKIIENQFGRGMSWRVKQL